jgi:precorrin-6A/cobalt-precorrin-6A reductase
LHRRSLLILGGTAEASALARALASCDDIAPVLSFAGRTQAPLLPPIPYRVGGFGGSAGLIRYLRETRTEMMIDATHPFAARMSHHASEAATATGIAFLAIRRPAWQAQPGDRWTQVADLIGAAEALGPIPRHVFLAIGRQELAPFRARPHHYVIRSVERPDAAEAPEGATLLTARGPFDEAAERDLFRKHNIDCLVTKNSGGVTGAKLVAARTLNLPVIIVTRPEKPPAPTVTDEAGALAWLHDTRRGV